MSIGVVYDSRSGAIRRIVDDAPDNLGGYAVGPGESMLYYQGRDFCWEFALQQIAAEIGKGSVGPSFSSRWNN